MSPARQRRIERNVRNRPRIVGAVVLLLIVLGAVSYATRSTSSPTPTPVAIGQVAPLDAESSQYTCGGLSEGSGPTHGTIILANGSNQARTATINFFDDAGHTGLAVVVVKPAATLSVDPNSAIRGGTWVGATVSLNGGGVGVVERLGGSNSSSTPCTAVTAHTWYLTGGTTQVNQSYDISLVNPTSANAVVDASFVTDGGLVAPQNAQGLVVAPHGVVSLSGIALAPHVSNLGVIVTATQGSIAVFGTQVVPTPAGASISVGQSSLETNLVLSRGVASSSTQQAIDLSNPTPQAQIVRVALHLPSGSVAPEEVTIAPYTSAQVITDPSTRVPSGDVFSAVVTTSGSGISAALVTQVNNAPAGGWGTNLLSDPASMAPGSWLLVSGQGTAPVGGTLTNPSSSPVTVHARIVEATSDQVLSDLDNVTIPAGSSVNLSNRTLSILGSHNVIVSSNGQLAVSEDFAGGAAPSVGNLIGLGVAN